METSHTRTQPASPAAGTLKTDHLPSGSSNGHIYEELRARYECSTDDLDGSPAAGGLDTRFDGAGESFALSEPSQEGRSGPKFGRHDARSAALENVVINASAAKKLRPRKWTELDWLSQESTIKAQRECLRRTIGKTMGVRAGGEGPAGFSGLVHCGRVLCPNCGPRIATVRREEINNGISNWRAAGGRILFGTLTLRHHRGQSFRELAHAISECWRAATGGRSWMSDQKVHGITHIIRVWEEKWSPETGWHLHVHFLLFVAPASELMPAPAFLLQSMFARWQSKALELGLEAPLLVGQDLHEVDGDNADAFGFYFAKQAEDAGEDATAKQLAWEMTGRDTKYSGESFTPAEIRALAVGGDPEFGALWAEYEQGMKGRRTIAFSRGLRDELAVKDEQAIVDEEAGGDLVLEMPASSWLKFSRRAGARYELLLMVMSEGPAAAVEWLHTGGFSAWLVEEGEVDE